MSVTQTIVPKLLVLTATVLANRPAVAGQVTVPGQAPTIQGAISMAFPNDTILVAPGTYHERINYNGKLVHIKSTGGPAVTIIDATGLGGNAVRVASGETSQAILEGFTVTGGTGEVLPGFSNPRGGGLRVTSSSFTVRNCIFRHNDIGPNSLGGGVYVENGNLNITNSIVHHNAPAGMYFYGGGHTNMINCTSYGNLSYGVMIGNGSSAAIANCIAWGPGFGGFGSSGTGHSTSMNNCCAMLLNPGTGITQNPRFIDPDNGDFRLAPDSPCINAGSNNSLAGSMTTDLAGNPRIVATTVDIGAYERQFVGCASDVAPVTGNGLVNVDDLLSVINGWGNCTGTAACVADVAPVGGNGVVNVDDLLTIINGWGACP